MATTILLRRGDATTKNPVLQLGEPGWDTVNKVMKVGDGHTAWNDLPDASSYVLPEYLAQDKVPTLGEDGKVLPDQLPDPIPGPQGDPGEQGDPGPQGEPQTSESLAALLQAEGPAKTHLEGTIGVTLQTLSALKGAELEARLDALDRHTAPFVTDTGVLSGVNPLETDLGTSIVDVSTNPDKIVTPVAHGLAVGDRVRFSEAVTVLYTNGSPYYVRDVLSATEFTVYANNGTSGAAMGFGGANGTIRVFKNVPERYYTWDRAWGAVTGDATGDLDGDDMFITATAHGLAVGETVIFSGSTIGGVTNATRYWVTQVVSAKKFRISPTRDRASVVDITSDGTATLERAQAKLLHLRFPVGPRTTTFPGYGDAIPDQGIIQVGGGIGTVGSVERRMVISSASFALDVFRAGTVSSLSLVYVEGALYRSITDADIAAAGINAGSYGLIGINFPDARPREISIIGANVMGVRVPKSSDLSRPATFAGVRWAIPGDSFTEDGAAGINSGWAPVAMRAMDILDFAQMGAGSTGYLSNGTRLGWVYHPEDLLRVNPGGIIPALGLNDHGLPLQDVLDAAETCWDVWLTAVPKELMPIIGPWPSGGGSGTQPTTLVALDLGLQALAHAKGLRYISPIQDGITFERAEGDNTHPSKAGARKLGLYAATRLSTPTLDQIS